MDPVPPILRDGVCSEDGKQEVSLTDIRHDIELIRKLIPSPEELKSLVITTILIGSLKLLVYLLQFFVIVCLHRVLPY